MNKETKYLKLMEAHNNNLKISNYNLDEKFKYFENDKLSESKTLFKINLIFLKNTNEEVLSRLDLV